MKNDMVLLQLTNWERPKVINLNFRPSRISYNYFVYAYCNSKNDGGVATK